MQKAGQGLVGAVEGYKCPASLPLGKAAGHTHLALNRGPGSGGGRSHIPRPSQGARAGNYTNKGLNICL